MQANSLANSDVWTYPYTGDLEFPPHEKQLLAHSLNAGEIFFGGSAGGGKTDWLIADVLRPIWAYGVDGLILRKTFAELSQPGGIIERLIERIPRKIGRYHKSDHFWRFRNGALLQLGYLDSDMDIMRYMGGEYAVIGWDQLEHFTEWQFRRMRHPLRIKKGHPGMAKMIADGWFPRMVATGNPGGIGHLWVKTRFIDRAPSGTIWKPKPTESEPRPTTRVFIQSRVTDNPGLAGTSYEDNLKGLPEDDRRALYDGDWDVYQGQRFGTFRRDTHVIKPEDYPIPIGGVKRAIGIDYGLSSPFAALWGAVGPDNTVIVYRELYEVELTPTEQAQLILASEMPGERGPTRPLPPYLDPSCWNRGPDSTEKSHHPDAPPKGSIAYSFRRAGLPVKKANRDRMAGVAVVSEALRVRKDGLPRLLIYNTCINLIRTLPALPRDIHNPEDVDTRADDHCYDSLRYLLMGLGLNPNPAANTQNRALTNSIKTETFNVRNKPL